MQRLAAATPTALPARAPHVLGRALVALALVALALVPLLLGAGALGAQPGRPSLPGLGSAPLPGRVVDVAAGEFFFQAPDSIPAEMPPATSNATLVLEPGRYVLACFVGSAREDRSRFHLLNGMFRALTVMPTSAAAAPAPAPEVVVRIAADGALHLSAPLTAGRRVIRVENAGATAYEFAVSRVLHGRTTAEALAWRRRDNPTTPRPFEEWGGLSDVPAGGSLITTMAFEPGDYFVGFADRRKPFTVEPARR